jgi:hypothetical protein
MNKKHGLLIAAVAICVIVLISAAFMMMNPNQTKLTPTTALDFTVSGSSDCLRFLNSSVPTFYVPFTVGADQKMTLTVNATKMPGGANGWTDIYLYEGFWDGGANHTCRAVDLYPIISNIESADSQVKANQPYTHTFGEATQQSYTVFFVVPPGGQAAFHVTLKPA